MPVFRFRAAAALELRQQQENAAATLLSRAEAAFHAARAAVDDAERQKQLAQEHALSVERRGTDGQTLLWHRNWIVHLSHGVDASKRDAETCAATVRKAEELWREARKRRLALERMRERAWRRYEDDERRSEMKVIDELARLRFIANEAGRDDL
jgi:flagellar export protein FliJ